MRQLLLQTRHLLPYCSIDASRLMTGLPVQKVPQTSVAPTYKLTLPSEFVAANLSHLIDQAFDLTDQDGSDTWKVALLPRR